MSLPMPRPPEKDFFQEGAYGLDVAGLNHPAQVSAISAADAGFSLQAAGVRGYKAAIGPFPFAPPASGVF
ncbi:hypothetical protein, partial [uncultured Desulfovibrio sp.]|uniref:hypothetical protein n=1 Tax=uncultured Desulfovibrio sp. TaxID=167968 RepID=UPI00260E53B4